MSILLEIKIFTSGLVNLSIIFCKITYYQLRFSNLHPDQQQNTKFKLSSVTLPKSAERKKTFLSSQVGDINLHRPLR